MSAPLCVRCTSHDRRACEGVRQFATITASCSCGCHFAPQVGGAVVPVSDAEADRDAQRTRAEAAEAEVARLRSLIDVTARDLVAAKASAEGWREEATGLRAAAPRTVPPTEAEAAAHNAALGWWLISREGVCPPAAVDAFRGDGDVAAYLPMARGATWLPLDRDGRPTAWPALDAAAPDVCECGHPVAMHRGADRCGAHGCGCDRDAKEAMWST